METASTFIATDEAGIGLCLVRIRFRSITTPRRITTPTKVFSPKIAWCFAVAS
jgi:hypothetical protein